MSISDTAIKLLGCFYEWRTLKKRYTVEQAEEEGNLKGHEDWERFKSKMRSGDKLYWYDCIGGLSGTAGFCIVRNGRQIEHYPIIYS